MARARVRKSAPVRPKAPRAGRYSKSAQDGVLQAERGERETWSKRRVLDELKKFEDAAKAIRRGDGWQNAITGLGIAGADWRRQTTLEQDEVLNRQVIDDLYMQDSLAAKVVDELAEDAVRKGFRIVGGEGDAGAKFQKVVNAEMTRLHAKQRFLQWLKLGGKDGGALMLIGADDGRDLSMPLDLGRVREIRHVHNLERWAIIPDVIDLDPLSVNFGQPLYYLLLPRAIQSSTFVAPSPKTLKGQNMLDGLRIHYSRVFIHDGIQVSERRKVAQRGWGFSQFQRCFDSIKNYRVLWAHIATLFKHVAQTVVKLAGYQELQAADFQNVVQSRIAQLQLARSTLSIVPIDKEDEIEEQTLRGLSGALEVLKYAQEDLAQATGMPLTKLFGHKPVGFADDDAAGMRNWNDRVRGVQEDRLLEPLTLLVELIAAVENLELPEDWRIEFHPLEELNALQEADRGLKDAQRHKIHVECGIVSNAEVRETLRADPRDTYILEQGAPPEAHPPFPDPSKVPPAKPSPGDPSQHAEVKKGPAGEQVKT